MTHAPPRSLRTTTALFAVLVLGSTSVSAQDAASSSAPTPTIVLPVQAPAPSAPLPSVTVPSPVVQQVPSAPAEIAAPAAAEPAEPARVENRKPTARMTAPAASAVKETARTTPVSSQIEALPPAPPVVITPPVPVAAPPVVMAAPPADDGTLGSEAAIAALLGAVGLAGAGLLIARSRRRFDGTDLEEARQPEPAPVTPAPLTRAVEPPVALAPVAPLPVFAAVSDADGEPMDHHAEPAPTARERLGTEELVGSQSEEAPVPDRALVTRSAVPALPHDRASRDALLGRMISAAPDAENPFTSRKARLRRARLILQRLEYEQKEAADHPFDWRTYKPSASNPALATPPRVTA